MKLLLKIPASILGYLVNTFPKFRDLIRNVHFKGKYTLICHVDIDSPKGIIIEECNGIKYELNLRDDIQKLIYFNVYEKKYLDRVLKLIPQHGICIDVGANVGYYALNFAKNSCKKVYAFEANPIVANKLRNNISLNYFEPIIEVSEYAVSDKISKVTFSLSPEENSGWGHIGEDERFEKIVVDTYTLDKFFEDKGLEEVDLMKVDVEGAEDMLIEGAQRVLSEQRIRHIFMEFCKMSSDAVKNRLNRLRQFGYIPDKEDEAVLERMKTDNHYSTKLVRNFLFHASKD